MATEELTDHTAAPTSDADRLRGLAERATQGPWYMDVRAEPIGQADFSVVTSAGGLVVLVADRIITDADAAYIAACDPRTIIAMLDERRSSADRMERYEAVVKAARDYAAAEKEALDTQDNAAIVRVFETRAALVAALDQEAAPVPEPTEERTAGRGPNVTNPAGP